MAEFTVQYERKFSDGNYGSEGCSMAWTWEDDDGEGEGAGEAMTAAADFLRRQVLSKLAGSASGIVSHAANHELNAKSHDERWRQAEESAELELAIGRRENARGGDDPDDLEDLPY